MPPVMVMIPVVLTAVAPVGVGVPREPLTSVAIPPVSLRLEELDGTLSLLAIPRSSAARNILLSCRLGSQHSGDAILSCAPRCCARHIGLGLRDGTGRGGLMATFATLRDFGAGSLSGGVCLMRTSLARVLRSPFAFLLILIVIIVPLRE